MLMACSAFLVALPLLWLRRRQLAGTTLGSMWWWWVAMLSTLAGVELYLAVTVLESETVGVALRYAAASLSFCPTMSVLGAKRPQDKAWNFIVLSLWVVVALPALEAVTLHMDQPMELSTARSWFLLVLVVVCLANRLGTRGAWAALVFAGGQVLLLVPYLPLGVSGYLAPWPTGGLVLLVASVGVDVAGSRWRRQDRHGWDHLWLDFRDTFGTLWALRVAERINAAAAICDWDLRLTWRGFRVAEQDATPSEAATVPWDAATEQTLRTTTVNLLRRFVTREWIDARLPVARDPEGETQATETSGVFHGEQE